MKPRLAILDSGDGDRLQTILELCTTGELQAQVTVVVSDARESRALDRAEAAGIPALYHPFDWYRDTGRDAEDYDAALVGLIAPYEPDWIVLINRVSEPGAPLLAQYRSKIIDLRGLELQTMVDAVVYSLHC